MTKLKYNSVKSSGLHPHCPKGKVNVKIEEGKLIIEPWFIKKLFSEPLEVDISSIYEIGFQEGDGFKGNLVNTHIMEVLKEV